MCNIRKSQAECLGYNDEKERREHLVTTGKIEGKEAEVCKEIEDMMV